MTYIPIVGFEQQCKQQAHSLHVISFVSYTVGSCNSIDNFIKFPTLYAGNIIASKKLEDQTRNRNHNK